MALFQCRAPGVEVSGAAVRAVVEGLGSFGARAEVILAEHGIVDPQPERWFPQQAWLCAFRQIAGDVGQGMLERIGWTIHETAEWPDWVDSVEKALATIDVAYHLSHRGGDIGHYRYRSTGPREGVMVCDNPYPPAFDLGVIRAVVRRFAPPDATPHVWRDESRPGRDDGADCCTYLVRW